ncbi:MAG: hypothetical protein ACRD1Y_11230 [Terriglobales bacterium]
MPAVRLIALNANSGSYTPITASIPARTVIIVEDGSVIRQGLQAQFPADGYAATTTYPSGDAIELEGAGHDGICGLPAQPYRAADVYCQLRSATASATTVRVSESESTV